MIGFGTLHFTSYLLEVDLKHFKNTSDLKVAKDNINLPRF